MEQLVVWYLSFSQLRESRQLKVKPKEKNDKNQQPINIFICSRLNVKILLRLDKKVTALYKFEMRHSFCSI